MIETPNPQLSIIVPWMANDRLFEDTLASVLRSQPDQCELIVPHGDHFVDRYDLAREVKFVAVAGDPNLNLLFNAALQVVSGQVIHLLRPGIEVDEGWTCRPVEILQGNQRLASVSQPILDSRRPSRILCCGINHTNGFCRRLVVSTSKADWRSLNRKVIGPSSWCAFYRTDVLQRVLQFNNQIGDQYFADSSLDLEIALTFKALGYQNQVAANYCVSSELTLSRAETQMTGCDTRRLANRFSDQVCLERRSPFSRVASFLTDSLLGISPAFVFSRLQAKQFSEIDTRYSSGLSRAAVDPIWATSRRPPGEVSLPKAA